MKLRMCGLLIACSLLVVGCQQNKDDNALPAKDTDNNKYLQVKNSDPTKRNQLSNKEIAEHLSNVASDVPNVNGSSAIVAGPYALVGIDVDKHLDRSRVGTIKYSVSEALQHDPYGKTAVVVADGDILERIRSMQDKIQEGHPIQGIIEELSAIIGRYMPDFPINEDQPQDSDQNKDIIDEEDKKNLEDIEREQSKTE